MIKIIHEVHHDEGEPDIFVPKFSCDVCGKVIEHLDQGIITFLPVTLENGETVDATVVHKGKCDLTNGLPMGQRSHWFELSQMAEFMLTDLKEWHARP